MHDKRKVKHQDSLDKNIKHHNFSKNDNLWQKNAGQQEKQ